MSTQADLRALLWNGSADNYVSLHPAGYSSSAASAIAGIQQVGDARTLSVAFHAMLWTGTAASAVSLHPAGVDDSFANDTDGAQQVGEGRIQLPDGRYQSRALLWSGAAESCVDLTPAGFAGDATATGVGGGQQVGAAGNDAMLWTGSAASAINLTPAGFGQAYATDTDGVHQVGYGTLGNDQPEYAHALLWNGSADSYIDLHAVLPPEFYGSRASAISGNYVFGWATTTLNAQENYHAIVWIIPEPSTLGLVCFAGLAFRRQR